MDYFLQHEQTAPKCEGAIEIPQRYLYSNEALHALITGMNVMV